MPKQFSLISLGCFRNTYDSEIIAQRFLGEGYQLLRNESSRRRQYPEVLILNTCGFIDAAKKESIEAIREAVSLKKKGKIKKLIVCGCLVARYRVELAKEFREVDDWNGIEGFPQGAYHRPLLSPAWRAFLKICEGCVNRCSYCAIPLIKGPLRSRAEEDILTEVRFLNTPGIRELNIIGQDITSWGKDLGGPYTLARLLKKILAASPAIGWIRLIYTHPAHITDELIDLIARERRICKYIDMPIQHSNDRILQLMNRPMSAAGVRKLIDTVRQRIPGVTLRTSVIVGFPGETEKDFKELLNFLKEVQFEHLGAFIYSRELDTPAYDFTPQVHPATKKRRFEELMRQQKEIAARCNQRFIGKKITVLIEEKQQDVYVGRTQFDAPEVDGAVFLKTKRLRIGEFYNATITDAYEYDLMGE
ncbi:MAG: MiaB/RimO family radical SAM methylthiotransferase [Candidatus Omnitrophota bacterium]|nr:MiaB/RimO family radical SAM methylthiotransferase [Candidatus Omnitrophota bacterium]